MRLTVATIAIAAVLSAAGCASNPALTSHSKLHRARPEGSDTAATSDPALMLRNSLEQETLKKYGVKPGTKQAAIVLKWRRELAADPAIQAAFPHGIPSPQVPAGAFVLADGLTRITAEQRAEFWSLYAEVAAAHLPDDCYGERNTQVITRRLMSFENLTDDETDKYMELVAAAVRASVRHDPEHLPTAAEHQAATVNLGKVIETNIKGKTDADRVARFMVNRASASVQDACWMLKTSIASIEKLSPADKEVILEYSLHQGAVAAAMRLPAPPVPASTAKAAPAAARKL
jgi:hypothetical protein